MHVCKLIMLRFGFGLSTLVVNVCYVIDRNKNRGSISLSFFFNDLMNKNSGLLPFVERFTYSQTI